MGCLEVEVSPSLTPLPVAKLKERRIEEEGGGGCYLLESPCPCVRLSVRISGFCPDDICRTAETFAT